ncbi:hypothetical protein ACFL6S_16915 [Candidatus Poribacteria bacterium]
MMVSPMLNFMKSINNNITGASIEQKAESIIIQEVVDHKNGVTYRSVEKHNVENIVKGDWVAASHLELPRANPNLRIDVNVKHSLPEGTRNALPKSIPPTTRPRKPLTQEERERLIGLWSSRKKEEIITYSTVGTHSLPSPMCQPQRRKTKQELRKIEVKQIQQTYEEKTKKTVTTMLENTRNNIALQEKKTQVTEKTHTRRLTMRRRRLALPSCQKKLPVRTSRQKALPVGSTS